MLVKSSTVDLPIGMRVTQQRRPRRSRGYALIAVLIAVSIAAALLSIANREAATHLRVLMAVEKELRVVDDVSGM